MPRWKQHGPAPAILPAESPAPLPEGAATAREPAAPTPRQIAAPVLESKTANAAKRTIRVDLEKVDRLVNLVGNKQMHENGVINGLMRQGAQRNRMEAEAKFFQGAGVVAAATSPHRSHQATFSGW